MTSWPRHHFSWIFMFSTSRPSLLDKTTRPCTVPLKYPSIWVPYFWKTRFSRFGPPGGPRDLKNHLISTPRLYWGVAHDIITSEKSDMVFMTSPQKWCVTFHVFCMVFMLRPEEHRGRVFRQNTIFNYTQWHHIRDPKTMAGRPSSGVARTWKPWLAATPGNLDHGFEAPRSSPDHVLVSSRTSRTV